MRSTAWPLARTAHGWPRPATTAPSRSGTQRRRQSPARRCFEPCASTAPRFTLERTLLKLLHARRLTPLAELLGAAGSAAAPAAPSGPTRSATPAPAAAPVATRDEPAPRPAPAARSTPAAAPAAPAPTPVPEGGTKAGKAVPATADPPATPAATPVRDAARKRATFTLDDETIEGIYEPNGSAPARVVVEAVYDDEEVLNTGSVRYYSSGKVRLELSYDPATRRFSGTVVDRVATRWTLDSHVAECSATSNVTAVPVSN